MRYWYDTEFIEDGKSIDLISIGMVAEDGRELYAVAEEIEQEPLNARLCRHDWLMKNVVPHLPLRPGSEVKMPDGQYKGWFFLDDDDNQVMPRRMIRNAVREFLAATPDVELWADFGAYDHVVLAQLFGTMMRLPDGVPMFTHDIRQLAAGRTDLPEQPSTQHNALSDARWVMDLHAFLTGQVG